MTAPLLALWLALGTGAYAPQQAGSAPLAPALETRAQVLGKQLRCAVCQGLSITDSPASMARAQLDKVRQLITDGKSDQEIRDYFVARYGEWALLSPPQHGFSLLVWIGPLALILLGLGVVAYTVRARPQQAASERTSPSRSNTVPASPSSAPAAGPTASSGSPPSKSSDPYLAAIRSELDT